VSRPLFFPAWATRSLARVSDELEASIAREEAELPAHAAEIGARNELEPYRRKLVLKRVSPRRLWRRAAEVLGDWDELFRGLPRQLAAVLRMLHRQELTVQLAHRHLEPSVNRLVFGMMVSALFLGSAVMWAAKAPPLWRDISLFGAFGCATACT